MENHFHRITDAQTLESLFARSYETPVVLFKHSNACPISSAAYAEMARLKQEVAIVIVQQSRDISREVATRTSVRHESPQALLLRNGIAVWSASHYGVTADAVERALSENGVHA